MTAIFLNFVGNIGWHFIVSSGNSLSVGQRISSKVLSSATSVLLINRVNAQLGTPKIVSKFTTVGYWRSQYSVKKRCTLSDLSICLEVWYWRYSPFAFRLESIGRISWRYSLNRFFEMPINLSKYGCFKSRETSSSHIGVWHFLSTVEECDSSLGSWCWCIVSSSFRRRIFSSLSFFTSSSSWWMYLIKNICFSSANN